MSKKVLLVSESQLKNQTIIEQNVDGKLLAKVIQNVQEIGLKPILGSDLYKEVIDEVYEFSTSGTTMTPTIKLLLEEYIQPYLLNAVLVDFLVVNNYKVTNKGVLKLKDDVGDNLSAEELENVKNMYDIYTVSYKQNLLDFLKENNLLSSKADTDTTSVSIGWYLN